LLVVESIEEDQIPYIIIDDKKSIVQLPANKTIDKMSASSSEDRYMFTLTDKTSYEKSIWVYMVESNNFNQLVNDKKEPISGSNALFAPDGKSIFYLDMKRSLIMLSEDPSQVPINLGAFDNVDRILPNEKGVFGFRNNNYTTILSLDGSEQLAPDNVQNNSLVQQFNSLVDYLFIEQVLDSDSIYLEQNLISYIDNKETIISTNRVKESLVLVTSLSPNDEFVVVEEATQPVIYDGIYPNGKPKNGFTNIIDVNSGSTIKEIAGYDIKWKL
jgi:hypothetical protein